jgi:hypothetical protein
LGGFQRVLAELPKKQFHSTVLLMMTFAQMKSWGVRLLVILTVFEVAALHLNRRPLPFAAKEILMESNDESYFPRLVCVLRNDRLTPVRYLAVSDDMPAYEIIPQEGGPRHLNTWCTSTTDHLLAPGSSREVWIWIPDPDSIPKVSVSIFYEDTSVLSWLTRRWADDRRARVDVDLRELPRSK